MRLKVAAFLFVALSHLVDDSWGLQSHIGRGGDGGGKKTTLGSHAKYAYTTGSYYRRNNFGDGEEISKLRVLKWKDEESYKNIMSMIADGIAAESGDGETQIMMEMLDELASMPDEEFKQFMAEHELEGIADSDELLLSNH
uniref:uncharacterized protein LOC120339839 n=1 Tax=Styela clava TaxID=7725 RepID=UPI00193A40AB|nr:uncharacterized protein LOC120339839 [Styela clava]